MSNSVDSTQPDNTTTVTDSLNANSIADVADLSGARESNAGDDFHFLWAVRSALQLLSPSSPLTGLVIEGVSQSDRYSVGDDELLLGVDLTEYYGGNSFAAADKVVFSQLKYSTRHPATAWSAARLCERKSKRKNDSVIKRLADVATAFVSLSNTESVTKKASIRLVSNQPASDTLVEALRKAKELIESHSITLANQLWPHLTEASRTELQTLYASASTSSRNFIVLIALLDLSHCGTGNRALLRVETLKQFGLSSLSPADQLRRLYDLIKDLAGPGHEEYFITRSDVLAALDLGTDASLFPALAKIESPRPSLETDDARRVAEFVLGHCGQHVIVHGPAGVGKTTTTVQLKDHLPEGAEVFQYDCFGGGDYLDLGQERHRPEECFVQLANEFAVGLGTPFYLRRVTDSIDVGRLFRSRVQRAAEVVGADGLLVIILDAADNAVTAARELGSRCFVPDLRRLELPQNCCIVYSARTHRIDLIDDSDRLPQLALQGFTEGTTALFTRAFVPDASDDLCREVHRLSDGIPRFESYLLSLLTSDATASGEEASDVSERLRCLAPRALESVFDGILSRADLALSEGVRSSRAEGALPPLLQDEADKRSLANLVVLARPITIDEYAEYSGLALVRAERFCAALNPGIKLDGRVLRFRDEDFETYLRSKVPQADQEAARRELSDKLFAACEKSTYAATHVGHYLLAAGRWREVIELALEGPEPEIIPDEVTRLHVRMTRFALALSACAATLDFQSAARLLVKAAEAQRTSETVLEMVRKHPDLAALYGDVERLGALYMREHEEALQSGGGPERVSWLGAAHMRVAAMYAQQPELHSLAREHLRSAGAWLRMRHSLPKHERHSWEISDEDVASEAEAVFHLAGPLEATRCLMRWRPVSAVRRSARLVVQQLRAILDAPAAEFLISEAEQAMPRRLRTWGPAYLVASLYAEGVPISDATLERVAERMDRAITHGWRPLSAGFHYGERVWDSYGWVATLLEALVRLAPSSERNLRLVKGLMPPRPKYTPSGHVMGDWELTLRFEVLRAKLEGQALSVDDLMPETWKEELSRRAEIKNRPPNSPDQRLEPRAPDEDDLSKFRTFIRRLLPANELLAETIVRPCTVAEIKSRVETLVAASHGWSQYEAEALSFRSRCDIAWEAISNCVDLESTGRAGATEILTRIADNAEQSRKVGTVETWLHFANSAALLGATRDAALELVERIGAYVDREAMPARERWDALMRCARIALPYAAELCQDLYRRGIEAAEDVDDESLPFINSVAFLARSLGRSETEEQRRSLTAALRTVAEQYRLRFSDEKSTPWDEVLQAVSALDARAALSSCYHWDRNDVRVLSLTIPTVVAEAVRSRQLEPSAALALLSLCPGDWEDRVERYGPDTRFGAGVAYREALLAIQELGSRGSQLLDMAVHEVGERLCRDFGAYSRQHLVPSFVSWADDAGINTPSMASLREVAAFCKTLPERAGYGSDTEWEIRYEARRAEEQTNLENLLTAVTSADMDNFSEKVASARTLDYDNGVTLYVRTLAGRVSYGQRSRLIQEILAQASERGGEVFVSLARELLDKWRNNPEVVRAADDGVRRLLTHSLRDVVSQFHSLIEIARSSVEELLAIYLKGVADNVSEWGSSLLFLAFRHVSQYLPEDQRWAVVMTATNHLLDKVEIPAPTLSAVAPRMEEAVAGLLFTLTAHMDAHVRWDVLHGARWLSRAASDGFLSAFVPMTFLTDAPAGFEHDTNDRERFRWMTARVYALLLLERVTDERPAAMQSHVQSLQTHLFSASFPHAQVRELARRALLRFKAAFPDSLDTSATHRIEWANRPSACLYPSRARYSRQPDWVVWDRKTQATNTDRHFEFDTMDVVPYWFHPASEVFHLDTGSFVRAAEDWAIQLWDKNEDESRPNWEALERRYPSGADMMRHGTLPRVETAATYVSYHAMHLVMGQLVDELPISVPSSDYEDEPVPCPWEGWLSKFVPSEESQWLADIRQATPLGADLWVAPQKVSEWLEENSDDAFDRIRFPRIESEEAWTLVYSSISYQSSEIHGSSRVVSALVSPDKAVSLLGALEADGARNWQLPMQGWSHDDWSVRDDGFSLEPCLKDERYPNGFDHLDAKAKDVPTESRTEIGEPFLATIGLVQSRDRRHWHDAAGQLAARFQCWSDNPQTERVHGFFTDGNRLWVRRDIVLELLQRSGHDLIVSTVINRDYSYDYTRQRDIKRRKSGESVSLHILRADGSIETMAGRRATGTGHSQGVGAG